VETAPATPFCGVGRMGWELICELLLYCGLQGPFPYEGEEDPDLINAGKSVSC